MAEPNNTSAPGETSLDALLCNLSTYLHPETFVFVTIPLTEAISADLLSSTQLLFREHEGITLILPQASAELHHLAFEFPSRMITLTVHSSLDAVGFMAVIATRLAQCGMGVNPVSGFYHDHLFVPVGRDQEAIRILGEMAQAKRRASPEWSRQAR